MKNNKDDFKDIIFVIVTIVVVPILVFILDLLNLGFTKCNLLNNISEKIDWISFAGSYGGAIISLFGIFVIYYLQNRRNMEVIQETERPFLNVDYIVSNGKYMKKEDEKGRVVMYSNLIGVFNEEFDEKKKYLVIKISNTGKGLANLDTENSNIEYETKVYRGTEDGEDLYEYKVITIKLEQVIKRLSIMSGCELYIVINDIGIYENMREKIVNLNSLKRSCIVYSDLYRNKYEDYIEYTNGRILIIKDNLLIK